MTRRPRRPTPTPPEYGLPGGGALIAIVMIVVFVALLTAPIWWR